MAYEKEGINNKTGMGEFFQADRDELLKYGITLTPAMVINGHPYLDSFEGEAIF